MTSDYKRPPANYFRYLILMTGALVLFSVYSLIPGNIEIFGIKLKKIVWRDPSNKPKAQLAYPRITTVNNKVDSSAQRFLLIGDSMNEFLRIRMQDYCRNNGHTMNTVIWYSSSTLWYGQCDTIAHFIRKFKPTYVVLTIGSNELFIKDIIKERDAFAQHVIDQIDTLPYIWVGPPNWKDDTGINDLIISKAGRSRYFESKKLSFKRGKDGAHPVRESAYAWMDSIAKFLQNDAAHRVLMNPPKTFENKVPPTVILSPNPQKK